MSEETSSPETIWIITDETPSTKEDGSRGASSENPWSRSAALAERATKGVKVSVQKLEAEMSKFLQVTGRLFNQATLQVDQKSGLRLDEVELSVEINGEGQVKLVGTGGKAGAKGAITLKFKRTNS